MTITIAITVSHTVSRNSPINYHVVAPYTAEHWRLMCMAIIVCFSYSLRLNPTRYYRTHDVGLNKIHCVHLI